ncbi:hypothetical protein JKF63_06112 [Porcisia hertigi]|uniref:Uncharacterized protein n=1 Tax=Porcisia hertigi TaxID=2761500 RepID=A0A836ITQ8_9TRYP|nr:hypothetical protein JKF63_06112 [Porcisia hertigi]
MVRTREKKPKGDSAFTTRKQKVGRKKLAPATATRAEVHARTLRLATSTAMSSAMAAPYVKDPATHPAASATAPADLSDNESRRKRPVISVQSFSELLSGTHHYKAAQRASAFATLTRLLRMQRDKEATALATALRHGSGTAGGVGPNAFDEYMRYAADGTARVLQRSLSSTSPAGLAGVSPLEKLKSFAAALEAVTDTNDDVRHEALQSLQVLVDYQWISPELDGSLAPTPSSSLGSTSTREAADLERCNMLLLNTQDRDGGCSRSALAPGITSVSTSVDRVQAILQAVHVALTHALKPVRYSGVELLSLLLQVAPPSLVRTAARAVCRHQTSYYYALPTVMSGSGLTMGNSAPPDTLTTSPASTATTTALEATRTRLATLLEEEEQWMLTLVRRVSSLVLRTKHMPVLPTLLSVFLGDAGSGAVGASARESITAALLRGSSLFDNDVTSHGVCVSGVSNAVDGNGDTFWRHPELVTSFFDDVASQWANYWKELMELRLELLRQDDKLSMASALAQSFAIVLVFLQQQQQRQQQQRLLCGNTFSQRSKADFFSRDHMHYIKVLFIDKMPVTMQELLLIPSARASTVASTPPAPAAAVTPPPKAIKARLELGMALVMVCVPLAGTDEGWRLMRDYFSIVFSLPCATALQPAPLRFPSVTLLEMSVRLFVQVMQLYPCAAPHLHPGGNLAVVPSRQATWLGDFSVSLTTTTRPGESGSNHRRARRDDGGGAARPSALSPTTLAFQKHSVVAERLLALFPAVLTTIIRHLAPRSDSLHAGTGDTASDDIAVVRVLLCAATVVEFFAALPDVILRRGGTAGRQGCGSKESTAAKQFEEGFALVPRLLFALRDQTQMQQRRPEAVKLARSQDGDSEGSRLGDAPVPRGDSAATPVVTRTGVLLAYNGIVDLLVQRFLRVLWFLGSSGHPLLHNRRTTSTSREVASASSTSVSPPASLADLLMKSITFLFGSAGTTGVLQRCSTRTVLLAHSTLFYLGGGRASSPTALASTADAANTVATGIERAPMVVAAETWADMLDVTEALRIGVHTEAC